MKMRFLVALIAAGLVLPGLLSAQVTGDIRLAQNPRWDGATVNNGAGGGFWLLPQFRYQSWDSDGADMKAWMIGPVFAWSPEKLNSLEVGTRFYLMNTNPDGGDSETGFSDIDIWGKYQVMTDPLLVSVGISFTLPTGGEKIIHPWASGEFNFEMFGACRYYTSDIFALVGHLGIRINADADIKIGGVKGEIDGETQFEIGGGVLWEPVQQLDLTGELNFATEAYKDGDSDIEITAGGQYFFSDQFSANLALGIGLDDGAPKFEIIPSALILF